MHRVMRIMEGLPNLDTVLGGQVRLLMSEGAAGRTSVKTCGFRFKPVRGVQLLGKAALLAQPCRPSHTPSSKRNALAHPTSEGSYACCQDIMHAPLAHPAGCTIGVAARH